MNWKQYVLAAVLLGAVVFGWSHLVSGPPPEVVATVDDEEISFGEHQARMNQIIRAYEEQGGKVTPEVEDYVREAALDDLISETLLYREALRWNISVDDRDVQEAFQRFRDRFEEEEQARAYLQEMRMTEDSLKEQISRQMKIERFLQIYMEELDDDEFEVTDEHVQELYDQYATHMEDFPAYEDVASRLRAELEETRHYELLEELVAELRDESQIEIKIELE